SFHIIAQKPSFLNTQKDWVELINGQNLNEWQASENKENWKAGDSMFTSEGKRSHLFYNGPELKDGFKNFEIEVVVKTHRLANSGIYFHTTYQESGWPSKGIEIQVNNTHVGEGEYIELKKMGSLYGYRNVYKKLFDDYIWQKITARVTSNRVEIWYNNSKTVDYAQPANLRKSSRSLSLGTFALHGPDPLSKIQYRSFKVRRLPDELSAKNVIIQPIWMDSIMKYQSQGIPFIDLRPQGANTISQLISKSYESGINVGRIYKTPITGQQVDVYFKGKIVRLPLKKDPLADYTIGIHSQYENIKRLLKSEMIDIWADTSKTMDDKNVEELLGIVNLYSVAIEIDNVARWPSISYLTIAKKKGLKFSFSGLIDHMDENSYIFEVLRTVNLDYKDFYIPD
ncbi:MAG TPA: DUF1080 domain-containing protein, partial [Saprospiraceae bacterium]|nr:DUF1080 domain-containing protein [Saprospiraceae bacterium]